MESEAMKETLYLLGGKNGRVLRQRLMDLEAGEPAADHELIDPDRGIAPPHPDESHRRLGRTTAARVASLTGISSEDIDRLGGIPTRLDEES